TRLSRWLAVRSSLLAAWLFEGLGEMCRSAKHRRSKGIVQAINCLNMRFCGNNCVAGIDMSEIHEGQRHLVLIDDAGRRLTLNDFTENARIHLAPPRSPAQRARRARALPAPRAAPYIR